MSIIMRTLAVMVFVALASATDGGESFEDAFAPETELIMTTADANEVSDLMTAVKKLREHAPPHLTEHMRLVSKHAKALQLSQDSDRDYDDKAKAYTHNFEAASRAIKAALSTLRKELQTGHNHDVGILKSSKASASSTLTSGQASAANKVKGLKHEGCPTKRAEEKADEDKKKAKRARDDEKNKKICPLNTTWDDMDIHKSVPKYGAELRNAWDKARARWVSRDNAYKAAIKAHETSIVKHEEKIAAFKTATKLEARATNDRCNNAHKEYEALKKDVQSNVNTRKQVDISAKVVQCYVDHMTDNAKAKACADKARKSDVSIWNIDGGKLSSCASTASLEDAFGPLSWTATKKNCAAKVAKSEEEVETRESKKEDDEEETLLEELEF